MRGGRGSVIGIARAVEVEGTAAIHEVGNVQVGVAVFAAEFDLVLAQGVVQRVIKMTCYVLAAQRRCRAGVVKRPDIELWRAGCKLPCQA